jgi:hypothetical protein
MVFRGHLRGGEGLVNRRLSGQEPEAVIASLFEDPRIAFISVQNEEAACFMLRIERT